MKHLKIHKFPFKNVIVLAIECKMYLKNFTALVAIQNIYHVLRCEENKVEFLEGWFLDEKLPFLHEKKAEHSFDLSLSIFCLLMVYFKPWNAELLSWNICMVIAQQPFCWKWMSVTKVSKCGKSEYSQALNASYTFQPFMSFWSKIIQTFRNQLEGSRKHCSLLQQQVTRLQSL